MSYVEAPDDSRVPALASSGTGRIGGVAGAVASATLNDQLDVGTGASMIYRLKDSTGPVVTLEYWPLAVGSSCTVTWRYQIS